MGVPAPAPEGLVVGLGPTVGTAMPTGAQSLQLQIRWWCQGGENGSMP